MDGDTPELEEHEDISEEDRIFSTDSDEGEGEDEEEMELSESEGEDGLKEDTLDLFISILNEEYGNDNEQSDVEHSGDELN